MILKMSNQRDSSMGKAYGPALDSQNPCEKATCGNPSIGERETERPWGLLASRNSTFGKFQTSEVDSIPDSDTSGCPLDSTQVCLHVHLYLHTHTHTHAHRHEHITRYTNMHTHIQKTMPIVSTLLNVLSLDPSLPFPISVL